jgi:hypothetical protein
MYPGRASSDSCAGSAPTNSTEPPSTRSSPAAQCGSVDLPEPEGPMIAVKVPAGNSILTPSSAVASPSPLPYDFRASVSRDRCGPSLKRVDRWASSRQHAVSGELCKALGSVGEGR